MTRTPAQKIKAGIRHDIGNTIHTIRLAARMGQADIERRGRAILHRELSRLDVARKWPSTNITSK